MILANVNCLDLCYNLFQFQRNIYLINFKLPSVYVYCCDVNKMMMAVLCGGSMCVVHCCVDSLIW